MWGVAAAGIGRCLVGQEVVRPKVEKTGRFWVSGGGFVRMERGVVGAGITSVVWAISDGCGHPVRVWLYCGVRAIVVAAGGRRG